MAREDRLTLNGSNRVANDVRGREAVEHGVCDRDDAHVLDESRGPQNDLERALHDSEEEEELAQGRVGNACTLE
jgi:hypothetical protein